ncbi:hypothetical protein LCGC14_1759170 [marine sediment metagenome]|uniref:Uncharacterized protein n=1 Tax=marine sediment metagenome TaxID=412755 RepID=A0A0F9HNW3_9ZZZZ
MADRARQIMNLLGDAEEALAIWTKIKKELTEEYEKIDEALDKDGRDRSKIEQ